MVEFHGVHQVSMMFSQFAVDPAAIEQPQCAPVDPSADRRRQEMAQFRRGMLRMLDHGEQDDKILAVPLQGPLSDVVDLASLDAGYAGSRQIVETWFTHYKGPGRLVSEGFGDVADAMVVIQEASSYFEGSLAEAN